MSLNLGKESMPLVEEITKSINLRNTGIIIIQHGVRDAIDFALKLKENSKANVLFLPKPFSQNKEDLDYGENNGLNIVNPGLNYKEGLEKEGFLENEIRNFQNKNGNYLIEVGGISAVTMKKDNIFSIKGIVEITTFGHNRHIESETSSLIPVYSIARSSIKEAEAKHVGLAVYRSLDLVLHELNRDITNCEITMVGYGMIGQNVCKAFINRSKSINVYDKDIDKVIKATSDGFNSNTNYNYLIKNSDIIISSTGTGKHVINEDFIEKCKNGVLLVSAGSRQNEIDMDFLERKSKNIEDIHKFIKKYNIGGKEIFVFRDGKNANFAGNSCPSSSMDLIHAETLYCIRNILNGKYTIGKINETSEIEREETFNMHKKYWD
ncbi:hypothetical protein DLH72_01660 [Candidatus Gracilibacteria bacterium]|nr:MAG: hypothetical protein DLH72_01660 [Candidatus Gracilibacteria bacterium]